LDVAAQLVLLGILSLFPGASFATSFHAPLPDLVGPIDFATGLPSAPTAFDFGQEFSEIESVSIEIEAHLVAAQYDFCGLLGNPQPCVHVINIRGVIIEIDREDGPDSGALVTPVSISADPGTVEVTGTGISAFTGLLEPIPFGWDILLDGQGSLTMSANSVVVPASAIIENFQQASGEILGARLVIEATAIPEPSTALLLMGGMALLSVTGSGARRSAAEPRKTRRDWSMVLIVLLVILPAPSFAVSFSAALPDLVGPIDFATGAAFPPTTFDVGQQFASIESVSIEIEAHLTAAEWEFCGLSIDPQPCVDQAALVGFLGVLDEEDRPFPGSIFAVVSVPTPPGSVEETGTWGAEFDNVGNPFGWEVLLDGQGTLTLFPDQILFSPLAIIQNFQPASGEVLSARVIIEGTPVPEPSTALLLMAGMALLSGTRSHRTRLDEPWRDPTPGRASF